MHKEILSVSQKELLPLISSFSSDFGLIGGTAIALQVGHRRSIDFDLATFSEFKTDKIRAQFTGNFKVDAVLIDEVGEYTVVINAVKVTFLKYPFKFNFSENFEKYVRMPSLITLAAIKAYALGRRAKWKDYVDLNFIFKKHSLKEVVEEAKKIFSNDFNEKLFREELAYFEDLDYTEKVDYLDGFEVEDESIRQKLSETSLEKF